MPIDFACTCGKKLHAPLALAGKVAKCGGCGSMVQVPDARFGRDADGLIPSIASQKAEARRERMAGRAVRVAGAARPPWYRRYAYFLCLLALIPLIVSTFWHAEDHSDELEQALLDHPELVQQVRGGELSLSEFKKDLFATLPADRVTGALMAYESSMHWLMALVFAGGYFVFLRTAFQGAWRYTKGLLFAGVFTGTAGILLLLGFQFAAFHMPLSIIPRGVIGLIMLIVKLIGLSYSVADDPSNGFLLSFVGFTCGVGLCEEVTKIIPLLLRIRPTPGEEDPTWNSLLLWGLASGFGFGIAEGIMYSGRYYNGVGGLDIYLVRFLSCVTLHAMWAGAAGVMVYRRQENLLGADSKWNYCFHVVLIVLVPMILHGLYDTLLKKEMNVLALVVALASFGWLAFQIERQDRTEPLSIFD